MGNDTFHFKQFSVRQSHSAQKVGTDSDLLGALAVPGSRVLDIGTGTGVLALMMAQRAPLAHITAVEIDDNAVIDARHNFDRSPFADRIKLSHCAFQDLLAASPTAAYDSIVCNPPYFVRSLECHDHGRTRARHTASLPFETLVHGVHTLLLPDGFFSVSIPAEAFESFNALCTRIGLNLQDNYAVHTVPDRPVKRHVLIYKKGIVSKPLRHVCHMSNADRTRSEWLRSLLEDFLL